MLRKDHLSLENSVFAIWIFLTSCQVDTSGSISGAWYFFDSDSFYQEVLFSDTEVWTYDHGVGEIQFNYKIKSDSLILSDYDGRIVRKLLIVSIDHNTFELTASTPKTKTIYKRLNQSFDVKGIIEGNESARDRYFDGFYERRAKKR